MTADRLFGDDEGFQKPHSNPAALFADVDDPFEAAQPKPTKPVEDAKQQEP